MNRFKSYMLIYTAFAFGAGSLILFALFLFLGSSNPFNFGMGHVQALAFDAVLSMVFFLQHSILIRKSVRRRLEKLIPADYYGAFYSITSSVPLIILTLLWQTTFPVATAGGAAYWTLRILFFLCIAGFYWGVKSLGTFDPFGITSIRLLIRQKKLRPAPLKVKGPYLWVRHPLYFFSLVMIWSYPDLTADRLLFNIIWTVWIIIATMLEERDLMRDFGEAYGEYRSEVPMLFPYKIPKRDG